MSTIQPRQDRDGEPVRLAAIFRRRAEQLAQRSRQEASRHAGVLTLVLRTGDERFGIELDHVIQVFPRVPLTPVPGAPYALLGVANLSGLPRSVFDLGRLVNVRTTSDEPYIVLLNVEGKPMGLAVESVEEIRRFEIGKLLPVDDAASDSAVKFTKGLTDERIAVLDANVLLHHVAHQLDAPAREQVSPVDAAANGVTTTTEPTGTSAGPQFGRES